MWIKPRRLLLCLFAAALIGRFAASPAGAQTPASAQNVGAGVEDAIDAQGSVLVLVALEAPLEATPSLAAQQAEEQTPTQVYVAYYKISYADLEDWIAVYHEHAVPILQELQDEGVIQGWGVWQHSTGGEYNWRFAVRASDWSQFGQFWEEYLGRLWNQTPDSRTMIQAHDDEILDITEVNVPDGLNAQ